METTRFGQTDLTVSRIGLGTWAIGGWKWGGTDERRSIDTIHAAIDKGISVIDTAAVYGMGRSEEIVGEALASGARRDKVALATKGGLQWDDAGNVRRNGSRAHIERDLENSLRRLQTDRIDIYQVHWPDANTPLEETARAMESLYRSGKIRAIGVSNFSPEQMDAFREAAPLHSCQPPYNLFERGAEQQVLPYCRRAGLATLTYGALCRGLLSGRMSRERTFQGDDLRQNDPKFQPPRLDQYLAAVAALDELARERFGKNVLALALRWVLDQPGVTLALWGARRPDQLAPVAEVEGWHLDDDAMRAIDATLAEHVTDPVGPEFMAPPAQA